MSKAKDKTSSLILKKPRRVCCVTFGCLAPGYYFLPWEKMPKKAQEEVEENGSIPCEGGGRPGEWCMECRFGVEIDRDDEV
jgi:hypothetical protein